MTVAIVAILAAIAIPSYLQYIIRTNRSAAKSLLLQVADREEQFFADNKRYATDMTDLGYATNGFMIDDSGAIVGAASTERIYAIFLVGASATAFTVVASPQLRQAAKDAACGKFTLDNLGQRKATGGAPECW